LQWTTTAKRGNSNWAAPCLLQKDIGKVKGGLEVSVEATSLPTDHEIAGVHARTLSLGIRDDLIDNQPFSQVEGCCKSCILGVNTQR
jgi:hypothetical protein